MSCKEHDKVYSNNVCLTYPTQRPWVCRNCLKTGTDVDEYFQITDEYERLIKSKKEQANEQRD